MTDARLYRPYFTAEGLDAGLLRVMRFRIAEGLSTGSRCEVSLHADEAHEPRALLHRLAELAIVDETEKVLRRFVGVVTRAAEQASTEATHQRLRVTLESPLALLRLSSDMRIFQAKTTEAIVSEILARQGITADRTSWRLASPRPAREVCTQYGETMCAFVSRILEEDGISTFVEHRQQGPVVVFTDAATGWSRHDDLAPLPYRDAVGLSSTEALGEIHDVQRLRPAKYTLRDHDFERPALDLQAAEPAPQELSREHYDYPGRYREPADGKHRASIAQRAHVAAAEGLEVRGRALRLTAGHVVELTATLEGEHDGRWVVASVEHAWDESVSQPNGWETSARLLPAELDLAPVETHAKPRARGGLALVTTPAGEEIHCDRHGRIKLQFVWDRHGRFDDQSSGWARVGQMQTSGSVVIPRGGWEVLVEFEDGDPDRPVVLGRLYNPATPPLDSLPAGKSNSALVSYSTPGGSGHNELRMNDGGGGELVQLHAQKDLNLVVANDKKEMVATSATVGVANHHRASIGADKTETVGAKEQVEVGGHQSWQVGATRTKTVSGNERTDVKGDRSTIIAAGHNTNSSATVEAKSKSNLTEVTAGNTIEMALFDIGYSVLGSASISVGAAKVEAVEAGKDDVTIGARASMVGGAFLNVTPKDVSVSSKGAKSTVVGAAWLGNAGKKAELSTSGALSISVGGVVSMNATSIKLKVGGSKVTIANGAVVLDSAEIRISASGPLTELVAMAGSK